MSSKLQLKKRDYSSSNWKGNIPEWGYCLFSRHFSLLLGQGGGEHILNKDAVACGGVADEDVGNGAHDLAVLDNGAARHECGQVGTTVFNEKFKSQKQKQRIK